MTSAGWYEIQEDRRGTRTMRFDLPGGPYRTGAAGTRLFEQLITLSVPDDTLREITEAAIAWLPHLPSWIRDRAKPAHRRKEETELVVEFYLRALGLSWEDAKSMGQIYPPPQSSTADLSGRDLSRVVRP